MHESIPHPRVINWPSYAIGEHRIRCPLCDKGERDKTLGITIQSDGGGIAHCFRCDYTESYRGRHAACYRPEHTTRIQPAGQRATHKRLSIYGCQLWNDCEPVSGVARAYLDSRRCCIPPADGDLRWHSCLKHPCGYAGPALVALITDAVTGEPLSLHRTWLKADGSGKAEIDAPRLLLGGHRKQGGVIRLWPDEAVITGLGIAEGIETALSLAHVVTPVWSCIDAGNLAAMPVLPQVECLSIAADNDAHGKGLRSAVECAQRWKDAGRRVYVRTLDVCGDLNDAVQGVA